MPALKPNKPTGGWIGKEPTEYAVRASDDGTAVTLAVYCHYVRQGEIPEKYAGRVAHTHAELGELPKNARTFRVLVGHKPGPKKSDKWLATEITETAEEN